MREGSLSTVVIAPDKKTAAAVIGTFKRVVKSGELRMHPIVGRLVDKDVLEKLGARQEYGAERI